ncbi:GntR family transcriptional regulator [Cytobacillus purgationiresistens]|uniref:GntR family transcriptional regulator n=1 Tax=Cytobacillus purgationiresistens TaxID=863449 RepID=A0ABU0APS9_9BACI|nr:GntR family transcriptional regulator [Cytobacillus purgationiresistens]MDQ0273220.1 GntR family transcriptional regulator [Cytobacillus purgationiresistens]
MELPIRMDKDSKTPIYHQIEEQVKALIAGGHLAAGSTLPSIRSLSKELEISVITTRRAYLNLEQQGFIKTTQGKGTFVAEVEADKKKEVTVAAIYQALERGIETGLRHDYTIEQIEEAFQEIITSFKAKEKEEVKKHGNLD